MLPLHLPNACRVVFYIDKNRLIQLLANFVNNAIKFTQTGTICMGYRMTDTDTIYFMYQIPAVVCQTNSVNMFSNDS